MADIVTPGVDLGNLLAQNPVQQSGIQQQQQGTIPLLQQEALGRNIQNQEAMIRLGLLKNLPGMLQGALGQQGTPADQQNAEDAQDTQATGIGPMVAGYSASRQPQPWSPQMQGQYNKLQQVDMLYKSLGIPTNFADLYVKGPYDAENLRRSQLSTNEWKTFADAAQYGHSAIQQWNDPNLEGLKGQLMNMTDAQAKAYAARLANTAHTFSGQKTDYHNDQAVDSGSGRSIPNMPSAGMSRKDAEELANKDITWWSGNMEQHDTLDKKLHVPRQALVNQFMQWGPEQSQNWVDQQTARLGGGSKPPTSATPTTQGGPPPTTPQAGGGTQPLMNPATGQQVDTTGMSSKDVNLVRLAPNAPGLAPHGEGQLNPNQTEAYKAWTQQASKVKDKLDEAATVYNKALTENDRIRAIMSADPNLGPGSKELSSFETFMHQWFGTDPRGAGATQVLQKVLGTDQLNRVLSAFHGEGAQVRLGAYETRIIMEALAANPQMNKEAIMQLLDWQKSDSQYEVNKINFTGKGIEAGKDPQALGRIYESANKRTQNVETSLTALQPLKIAMPTSTAEYNALPNHTQYINLEGKKKWKNGPAPTTSNPTSTPAG